MFGSVQIELNLTYKLRSAVAGILVLPIPSLNYFITVYLIVRGDIGGNASCPYMRRRYSKVQLLETVFNLTLFLLQENYHVNRHNLTDNFNSYVDRSHSHLAI
ncbi:MAG: DUF3096 domain-containing protein [Methylobacter sp.]